MTQLSSGYKLDVSKDPLDLRDLMYEGRLAELPPWLDNRGKVPFLLDQGKEGACTGFALAAVVNFMLHNRSGAEQLRPRDGASARMLYEMARRYDEWEGTNYEGSSIRGAMKGWNKHGVCSETEWPSRKSAEQRTRLTPARQDDALKRPLGAYFRVRHLHLNHLHAALSETGILLASADVHAGWDEPDPESGRIAMRREKLGGHAFAIVGYDHEGLWIQNSWGRDWGLGGFAHISYDDWLENGYDCWVARLGVYTVSRALEVLGASANGSLGRVRSFDYVPHEAAVGRIIRPHLVNLGNDGRLSQSGQYQTDESDLDAIFTTELPRITKGWKGTRKLLLYAHGGLNDEKASAIRVASFLPHLLASQIYPIHFMWETGIWETLRNIVTEAFSHRRFGGIWDSVKDRFADLADEAIELATRSAGKALWGEMKENATLASARGHGADQLAERIANYALNVEPVELHLVGHSAGSILLSNLVPALWEWDLRVETLSFFAPACTTELFCELVLPYFGAGRCVDRITIFNLSDQAERDDNVAKVYRKSLLYLVSEAFEPSKKTAILGMDRFLKADKRIVSALGGPVHSEGPTVIYSKRGASVTLRSESKSHGGFDNDAATLDSMLRIVKGTNAGVKGFGG